MERLTFKKAERNESGEILEYIKKLADYENRSDEVTATEEDIEKWVFDENHAQVIFAHIDGETIGFALYFLSFSTYIGNVNMHLEDLFIDPEHRSKGYGKAFFKHLSKIALKKGYGRMEWTCLEDNLPAIEFYKSIGSEKKDWNIFHFTGDALKNFAEK